MTFKITNQMKDERKYRDHDTGKDVVLQPGASSVSRRRIDSPLLVEQTEQPTKAPKETKKQGEEK